MTDQKIDIAVGLSARSKSWKNQKWLWSDLVEKLLTEHKTNEKFKEFISANKTEQLKIKDVGGYVGGYLRGGRRKPENVLHRQLVTLDIDNAHSSFWDTFKIQFDNAAVLHSTHKHTESDPRYRLVMPLSRECTPDEYAATSRYIAGVLGIDLFDNTTFQPERLMFWPSNSIDAEYYAVAQDGPFIDVDEILGSYVDWTDSSAWPTSESATKAIHDATKKQQDPEIKRGMVGAFCRTYGITEAIETFLQDDYTPAGEGRFTYSKGSAAAGLVVYEDKFAYSHHGTDPSGGMLCNSFDLVRIHLYGHLDPVPDGGVKSKSFKAMEDFCREDDRVKKTLANEKILESNYDFSEEEELEENDIDWSKDLELDGKGNYVSSSNNLSLIFNNDPRLKGVFMENIFSSKKYIVKSVPWRKIQTPEPIKNVDFSGVRSYIEGVYGISSVSKVDDALNLAFEKHSFHPVRDYLNSLEWDEVQRIDNLLIDYFGADNTLYSREAIRKMLVGAVARIYNPGVKFDLVLTLVGNRQGTGKSTFISKLGGKWFSDSFHTVSGKEAFEQLQGAWLIEMAELSGVRKSEVEAIKHFITKQEDTFRPAYGRITETYKRQCVFFATTNERDFLRDPSGNRRFLPVDVVEERIKKSVFSEEFDESIPQIWAEAVHLYRAGERLYLSSEAEGLAKVEQSIHSQTDDRTGLIVKYLDTLLPEDWEDMDIYERQVFLNDPLSPKGTRQRMFVCVAQIWCECFGKDKNDLTRYNTKDINDIMRVLDDWEQPKSTKVFSQYGTQRYFSRKLF